jgi:hypothetical protein
MGLPPTTTAEYGRRRNEACQQHARRRVTEAGERVGRNPIEVERNANRNGGIRIDAGGDEAPSERCFFQQEYRDRPKDEHDVNGQRHLEELADTELIERRRHLLREPGGDPHGNPQHKGIHSEGGD